MNTADARHATPVHPLLRTWIGAEVLFAVLAGRATFIDPARAGLVDPAGFAWPIPVVAMAAILGVVYAASLPAALWALTMKTWQELRVLAIPLAVFTTMMTVLTFVHWDKFNHGTNPFRLWMLSYVLPPFVFVWAYWRQQQDAAPVGEGISHPFGAGTRAWLRANGWALVAAAILLWAAPALLVDHAPFPLTPLTARSLATVVLLIGCLQLWMALEGDWRRVRVASLLLILVAVLLPLQLLRFRQGVDFGNLPLGFLLADSAVTAVLLLRPLAGERPRG